MKRSDRVLSADVGGTKTLLRVSAVTGTLVQTEKEELHESASFSSLGGMIEQFLKGSEVRPAAACLAVAGPADGETAVVTNLGWRDSAKHLESLCRIPRVRLVNDFHAIAAGIPHLASNDLVPINAAPRAAGGPEAILGAGTGLGEAISISIDERRVCLSTEGGHASFAPRSSEQRELLAYLEESYGHVSCERVLSGHGIVNIFTFYCLRKFDVTPDEAGLSPTESRKAALVSSLAADGHEIARRTMETFVDIYGAEAGNLALKVLPAGGVFVCGGIAAKNLDWFRGSRFLDAYADKGRMRDILLEFPVDVVSNQKLGLLGATAIAVAMTEGG